MTVSLSSSDLHIYMQCLSCFWTIDYQDIDIDHVQPLYECYILTFYEYRLHTEAIEMHVKQFSF